MQRMRKSHLPTAEHFIPNFSGELVARRANGATWVELAEWVWAETGMEFAPTTLYRWHQHLTTEAAA